MKNIDKWRKQIPLCLGIVDHKFAIHPLDNDRASVLLEKALQIGLDWNTFIQEIKKYLTSVTTDENFIKTQMDRVMNLKTYFENK